MTDRTTRHRDLPGETTEKQFNRRDTKKQHTRRLLIEAAAEVIATRGFHAASLMEIASRAQLTTGAVYSNFRNKEDLFLAVITEASVPLDLGVETAPPWVRLNHAAVQAARGVDLPASRRLLKLQLEFALLTLQDPALMQEFVHGLQADLHDLAALLDVADATPFPAFSPSSEQLAIVLMATLQGLLQHRFLDRATVPEDLVKWTVQALLYVAVRERSGNGKR